MISEINNTLEGINNRLDEAEDRISFLGGKVEKNNQAEKQKEKRMKRKWGELTRSLGQQKCNNNCIVAIPEGEESEQGIKNHYLKT